MDSEKEVDLLHDIDTRVRIMESELARIQGVRRVILGMAAFLIIQAIGAAIGYGQLLNKVDNLNLSNLERDVSTALLVLGDHGTEFKQLREEILFLRAQEDSITKRLDERTKDRFYRDDGLRLEKRIQRLEDHILSSDRINKLP